MTVAEALAGAALPMADAEILLARAVGKDRTWLIAHPNQELPTAAWTQFHEWVERRRSHEPVAYILGEQEFYGRSFSVDRKVLIPRPATEGVVRGALRFLKKPEDFIEEVDAGIMIRAKRLRESSVSTIVDIGTGSGCIAITLALERPNLQTIATDISADALDVARSNAERHGVNDRMTFTEGSELAPIQDITEPFLMVSNPPYIPEDNDLMEDVKNFEPHVALFGGKQGVEIIQHLELEAMQHPYCVGLVVESPKLAHWQRNPSITNIQCSC